VIDVEQHALRALEQDTVAARLGVAQRPPHRFGVRQDEIGDVAQLCHQRGAVDRGLAEARAQRVVVRGQPVELRAEIVDQVFRRILLVDPTGLRVDVEDGVVTLAGEVPQQSDAELAAALVSRLEGVVAVENRLSYRFADASGGPLRVPLF